MKKLIYLLAVASVAVSGCKKEPPNLIMTVTHNGSKVAGAQIDLYYTEDELLYQQEAYRFYTGSSGTAIFVNPQRFGWYVRARKDGLDSEALIRHFGPSGNNFHGDFEVTIPVK